ncbi:TPA: hypothetical protein P7B83_004877 [Escherichia coli]|nr:hypothetical protein [Escherichia coli]HDP8336009.1 hypothetical protein [Escherichia coli]
MNEKGQVFRGLFPAMRAINALTVVMKCSSLKQPEDKHLASQHKPQERPINGSPYGEHPVEEEAWPEP